MKKQTQNNSQLIRCYALIIMANIWMMGFYISDKISTFIISLIWFLGALWSLK